MSLVHGGFEHVYDADMFPFARAKACEECLAETWERVMYGGATVYVNETPGPVDPWGVYRFQDPPPMGGFRLVSWRG